MFLEMATQPRNTTPFFALAYEYSIFGIQITRYEPIIEVFTSVGSEPTFCRAELSRAELFDMAK